MLRIPTYREPTHPGVMLQEEFLLPLGMTPQDLAEAILLPYAQVAAIVNRQQGITAGIAYRLSRYFGNTPNFWLNLQMVWDMYHAQRSEAAELERIQPLVWEDYPDLEELAEGDGDAAVAAEAEAAAG